MKRTHKVDSLMGFLFISKEDKNRLINAIILLEVFLYGTKNIIYSVSGNVGVGLWTSICRGFAAIFGVESKNYNRKVELVTGDIKTRLEIFMRQHPDYDFEYLLVSDGTLSFVGTVKGTLREQPKPAEVIIPVQPEKPAVEPTVVKEEPVASSRDRNSYKIDEKIVLKQDYEFDGVKIPKGSKGVIDNYLTTYGGRTYIVIFDKFPGKEVKITGDHFE